MFRSARKKSRVQERVAVAPFNFPAVQLSWLHGCLPWVISIRVYTPIERFNDSSLVPTRGLLASFSLPPPLRLNQDESIFHKLAQTPFFIFNQKKKFSRSIGKSIDFFFFFFWIFRVNRKRDLLEYSNGMLFCIIKIYNLRHNINSRNQIQFHEESHFEIENHKPIQIFPCIFFQPASSSE